LPTVGGIEIDPGAQLHEGGDRLGDIGASSVRNRHAVAQGRGPEPLTGQQAVELLRRAADPVRNHHESATVDQGAPDLPHREIECRGVEQSPDVALVEAVPRLGRAEQPRHRVVLDRDALGRSGRAGRVDDVRRVVRRTDGRRIGLRLPVDVGDLAAPLRLAPAGVPPGLPAVLQSLPDRRLQVRFDEPCYGVAPGQAVVCYDGDRVLGGGWIE